MDESPEYRSLVEQLLADPLVTETTMMGMPSLKIGTRLFAALSDGCVVVKVGRDRALQLIAAGRGQQFDPSHQGRAMNDWAMLAMPADDWLALALEAKDFVVGV